MDAKELWETTMDPSVRVLRQVTLDDAAAADELFSILMGEDVEARRSFITLTLKMFVSWTFSDNRCTAFIRVGRPRCRRPPRTLRPGRTPTSRAGLRAYEFYRDLEDPSFPHVATFLTERDR